MTENLLVLSAFLQWAVIGILLHSLFVSIRANKTALREDPETLLPGEKAPEVNAHQLTHAGLEPFSSSSITSENVVYLFFSFTCSSCIEKIPFYNELYGFADHAGFQLLIICLDEQLVVEELARDYVLLAPLIVAPPSKNPVRDNFKVPGMPSYCFITNGKVEYCGFFGQHWIELTSSWRKSQIPDE